MKGEGGNNLQKPSQCADQHSQCLGYGIPCRKKKRKKERRMKKKKEERMKKKKKEKKKERRKKERKKEGNKSPAKTRIQPNDRYCSYVPILMEFPTLPLVTNPS